MIMFIKMFKKKSWDTVAILIQMLSVICGSLCLQIREQSYLFGEPFKPIAVVGFRTQFEVFPIRHPLGSSVEWNGTLNYRFWRRYVNATCTILDKLYNIKRETVIRTKTSPDFYVDRELIARWKPSYLLNQNIQPAQFAPRLCSYLQVTESRVRFRRIF